MFLKYYTQFRNIKRTGKEINICWFTH